MRIQTETQWGHGLEACQTVKVIIHSTFQLDSLYLNITHTVILCSVLTAPDNGTIEFSLTSQLLGVDTTATYSCDPGYVLVGETTRTCEDTNSGTTGAWSGDDPICKNLFKTYLLSFHYISNEMRYFESGNIFLASMGPCSWLEVRAVGKYLYICSSSISQIMLNTKASISRIQDVA